ncbi:uncharacterized protein LOC111716643 isoform X2 [Eurytemora carolleeae]|uniref:uncharacterized protein LOC111716643 isoform X2 n=1 Tax=Eurytemora carolleeae TaxID=1294199 RepID=UPI000C75C0F6|nr:uncharacterized protein LOC111716643 isoform X2 [Eurytemora carolleeae]|eukprot:XP_023347888.1 uncharacterized protein LOC111716643 isoform X2 [Eurytemora affinis]
MGKNDKPTWRTWTYLTLLSLLSVSGGICSLIYGIYNVQRDDTEVQFSGLCWKYSLLSGSIIIIFTFVWCMCSLLFKSTLSQFRTVSSRLDNSVYEDDNNNNHQDESYKKSKQKLDVKKKTKNLKLQRRREELMKLLQKMRFLRIAILCSMMVTCLNEICATGIFWYTRGRLGDSFAISKNCFCSRTEDFGIVENLLVSSCPEKDEKKKNIFCLSVYHPVKIVNENRTSFTLNCQKLSGEGTRDPFCLEYQDFWFWFKILRVLLPLVIILKIPVILANFFHTYMFEQQVVLDPIQEASWLGLESMVEGRRIDPVQFYGNICAPVENRKIPPFEERLGPYGQEQEKAERSFNNRTEAETTFIRGEREEKSERAVPTFTFLQTSDSPPDKTENTFSTPVPSHKKKVSPNFNVSQVVSVTPRRCFDPNLSVAVSLHEDGNARARLTSFGPSNKNLLLSLPANSDKLPPPPDYSLVADDHGKDRKLQLPPFSVSLNNDTLGAEQTFRKEPNTRNTQDVSQPNYTSASSGSRIGQASICDIKDIAKRAKSISSHNVDWSKLP